MLVNSICSQNPNFTAFKMTNYEVTKKRVGKHLADEGEKARPRLAALVKDNFDMSVFPTGQANIAYCGFIIRISPKKTQIDTEEEKQIKNPVIRFFSELFFPKSQSKLKPQPQYVEDMVLNQHSTDLKTPLNELMVTTAEKTIKRFYDYGAGD